uniref:Immunoglobulin domain-containing protein n=1 Tax=Pelusios castaneus TaxID=367368 RepID=A0A8C8RHK0_9SAUR
LCKASAATPGGAGPWGAASVLISCLQPVPAQTSITIAPQSPAVGGDVSLTPQPPPQDWVICKWFRSASADENRRIFTYSPNTNPAQNNGSAHTGRETAGPGCVLNIAGLKLSDTGNYTVQVVTVDDSPIFRVDLSVYGKSLTCLGRHLHGRAGSCCPPQELAPAALRGGEGLWGVAAPSLLPVHGTLGSHLVGGGNHLVLGGQWREHWGRGPMLEVG